MNVLQALRTGISLPCVMAGYKIWARRNRPDVSSGRAGVGDISVFFRRYGSGEPVLLLHGGFMFAESWAGQIPALAREYQVIATDSRGHGRTALGTRPITYRQMAIDTAVLIEELGLGPVHLVGWSDGGCAGIGLALERPELLRSLVLIGTPFNTDNYTERARRVIDDFLRPASPILLLLRATRRLMTPEPGKWAVFVKQMRALWTELPDFSLEELGRISTPTLVVACDHDEFLSLSDDPLSVFKATAAAIPNARIAPIPGGTHSVNLERPHEVNTLILEFLAGL